MRDSRIAEVAWMVVIAVLIALGGTVMLGALDAHRAFGSVLLAALIVLALLGLRRAYVANAPSARADVTKAAAYAVAAVLAFVAIALHVHWAIGASIAAAEVAIVFDIFTIVARRATAPGE